MRQRRSKNWKVGIFLTVIDVCSFLRTKMIRCLAGNSYLKIYPLEVFIKFIKMILNSFKREIYLELSQKLNRKSESIIQWFKKRRAQERKQKEKQVIDEQETQDDEDREKLNSGPFSDDHRRILFASFDANQHPGRNKLFFHSKCVFEKFWFKTFCRVFIITFQSEGYRELAERLNRKKDSIMAWFRIKRKQKRQADQEAVPMEVENLPGITIQVNYKYFCLNQIFNGRSRFKSNN